MGTCVKCSGSKALTLYTFKVTDKVTGAAVGSAQCAIQDSLKMVKPLEGEGCITDASGVCSMDIVYFPPRYYSVYKAGYVTARGSVPGTTINVALVPTEILYWVAILAGVGGTVDPSGTYQVVANTKLAITASPDQGYILDYWLLNNVKSGNTNPLIATIDKDHYSIYAIFKEDPTAVKYWVTILAGVGGSVNPSGTYQVAANTKLTVTATSQTGYALDYWTVNGVKSGSTNPISVTVDRDNFNVSAVFKQTGAPPDGGGGATQTKRIWDNQGLKIPWNWSCVEDKKEVKFTWDPAKTTINSVKLRVSVTVDRTPGYVEFYLNDTQVTSLAWDGTEAPGTKDIEVDVKAWIYNGANVMKATHCKGFYVPWEHTAWITGDLIINYTGEPPVVPPPAPPGLDWWWPWAIAGGAIAILTVGGVVIYQEKERQELMLLMMARRGD